MEKFKISGFSDEISQSLDVQFEVLNKLGIKHFEVRDIDRKNVAQFSDDDVVLLKKKMDECKISISVIGSTIGKINVTDDFSEHFEIFKRVVEIAKMLDTKNIRMFSFFHEGDSPEWTEEERKEVFARIKKMIDYAKENDVVLIHENEKKIYGDTIERYLDLMKNFYCENFKGAFDSANFVQSGEDSKKAYDTLKKYVVHFHIKDARAEDGIVVPPGFGDGNYEYILKDLYKNGYDGFLTLEPHLRTFEGLEQLDLGYDINELPQNGEGTFTVAFNALNNIIKKCD